MDIEAAMVGRFDHGWRQDLPIGRNHRRPQAEAPELRLRRFIGAEPHWGSHRQTEMLGDRLNRARADGMASAGWSRWLAIYGGNFMASGMQGAQRRHGEAGAAHEGDAHQRRFWRCSFVSRRKIMLRLSGDR